MSGDEKEWPIEDPNYVLYLALQRDDIAFNKDNQKIELSNDISVQGIHRAKGVAFKHNPILVSASDKYPNKKTFVQFGDGDFSMRLLFGPRALDDNDDISIGTSVVYCLSIPLANKIMASRVEGRYSVFIPETDVQLIAPSTRAREYATITGFVDFKEADNDLTMSLIFSKRDKKHDELAANC